MSDTDCFKLADEERAPRVVTKADDAIDIALSARRAMQLLRDSSLAGDGIWIAADRAARAITDVIKEAEYIRARREGS